MHQPQAASGAPRPDILLVLADDMGFSDLGCYGGGIDTPHIDDLARTGVRFSQFYSSPRCSPTRASLLTGLHPHQVGIGILTGDERPEGYAGDLSEECHTVAEILRGAGYGTYLSGKWHLSAHAEAPTSSWPNARGFDRAFGTIEGAGSYFAPVSLHRDGVDASDETLADDFHYTDAIGENAAAFVRDHDRQRPDDPLFLFASFTAPHWPLHAAEADIAHYRDRFRDGWDAERERRLNALVADGILDGSVALSPRDDAIPAWESVADQEWQAQRMAVYAAQITAMDRAVGRILAELDSTGRRENTLVLVLSDNGACAEEMPLGLSPDAFAALPFVPARTRDGRPLRASPSPDVVPGPEDTFTSYGREWANVSNTPFREYKHWVHEGGISTPLIAQWPRGLRSVPQICDVPAQLVDILPTFMQLSGAPYPQARRGRSVPSPEGESLLSLLRGEQGDRGPLFWEHEGNAAVRAGDWKLVRKHGEPWALHDMRTDRTELCDLAERHPDLVETLAAQYEAWAERCGVIPRERILARYAAASRER